MTQEHKSKVKKTIKIDCPNRDKLPDSCHSPKLGATQLIYWDGTIEVKCPYCGYSKKM